MKGYFEYNKKSLRQLIVAEAIFFVLILFVNRNPFNGQKIIFSFLFSFGLLSILYLIIFITEYYKFRRKSALFANDAFRKLSNIGIKEKISQPKMIFFLADKFLFGMIENFPVRIESMGKEIHVLIGIEQTKKIPPKLNNEFVSENMTITELGIIRRLKCNEIFKEPDEYLKELIEASVEIIKSKNPGL